MQLVWGRGIPTPGYSTHRSYRTLMPQILISRLGVLPVPTCGGRRNETVDWNVTVSPREVRQLPCTCGGPLFRLFAGLL
jgi:hypothetical protein